MKTELPSRTRTADSLLVSGWPSPRRVWVGMNGSRVELDSGKRLSPHIQTWCVPPGRRRRDVSAELTWGSFPDCYFLPALLLSRETNCCPAGVGVTPPPTMSRALTALS